MKGDVKVGFLVDFEGKKSRAVLLGFALIKVRTVILPSIDSIDDFEVSHELD